MEFGLEEENIKTCAGTGLVVDIRGTGDSVGIPFGQVSCIALHADMDAIKMAEDNDLDYKSTTEWAHMNGNDGHMATMLGVCFVLLSQRKNIPNYKCVRILF